VDAALGFHVGDGVCALSRLHMADVLRSAGPRCGVGPVEYGVPRARALCVFLALFWTLRLIAGTFVFDMRPYLTSGPRRLGYHAINIVFAYLPVIYALAATRPHWLVD
jgi:hypothetical protein